MTAEKRMLLCLSTSNTAIATAYDGKFKNVFQDIFGKDDKAVFYKQGTWYAQRPIDGMTTGTTKGSDGSVWAYKDYNGDVQSDTVAQSYRLLGMMTSERIANFAGRRCAA